MAEIKDETVEELRRRLAQQKRQLERQASQLAELRSQNVELLTQSRKVCSQDNTFDGDSGMPNNCYGPRHVGNATTLSDDHAPSSVRPTARKRFRVLSDSEDEDIPERSDVEMRDADGIASLSGTPTSNGDGSMRAQEENYDSQGGTSGWNTEDADNENLDVEMSDIFALPQSTTSQDHDTSSRAPKRASALRAQSGINRLYKEYHVLQSKFRFKMVLGYPNANEVEARRSSELSNEMPRLWSLIRKMKNRIAEKYGVLWFEDEKIHRKHGPQKRFCVIRRFSNESTDWQDNDNGRYACKGCVASGSPCFTWTGDEFWLLPLRDQDQLGDPQRDRAAIWIR